MDTDLISEARRDDAEAALEAVFGGRQIDDIRPLMGGVSGARILRIEVAARAYVLRIEPLGTAPMALLPTPIRRRPLRFAFAT